MMEKLSKYICPKCGHTVEVFPGGAIACANCGTFMEESKKGVITKDAEHDARKTKGCGCG